MVFGFNISFLSFYTISYMSEIKENPVHVAPDFVEVTDEQISKFFEGSDPMEHIVNIELPYNSAEAEIVYYDKDDQKRIMKEGFKPFCWAKNSACVRMFHGNRAVLRSKMREYGIEVKALYTCTQSNPIPHEKLYNGYKYLFYAKRKMSMGHFQNFFNEAGTPLKNKKRDETDATSQEFMTLQPVELFMIQTGKRFFKGYDNYDDIHRCAFDLETTGTNPRRHRITQIGIRSNRGEEYLINIEGNTPEELKKNELRGIYKFLIIVSKMSPDVIFGHNSENFDWDFFIVRCEQLGFNFTEISKKFFRDGISKKKNPTTLKLGGEVETYYATVIKYFNVVDSLHAVRRAMATDSSFEKASLKYATKYLHLNKPNRVYVDGAIISKTWAVQEEVYAFNDTNGDWYRISEDKPLQEGYELKSGKYIVERYLLDDIWEADKVELTLHETDFQLTKIMPTTFMRVTTMGTATQWKLIMMDWAYQHNLALPTLSANKKFTGGLSRLLVTGYMEGVVKLDANSLYPSTILTWNITCATDIMGVMLRMLRYVLVQREHYKGLKKKAAIKAEELYHRINEIYEKDKNDKQLPILKEERKHYLADKINNDNQQLILKKLGNSFFGSFGCPSVFNFADLVAAEKTTCLGRMQLRVMIAYFSTIGQRCFPDLPKAEQDKYNYTPIVGDSVTSDTPLFIKYKSSGLIDIKPISEIFNESQKNIDELGREYDYSEKLYKVLCRTGWSDVNYVYRHSTNKDIYRVEKDNTFIDVTQDHSLFDSEENKIKPIEITDNTVLEENKNDIYSSFNKGVSGYGKHKHVLMANMLLNKTLDRVPHLVLNDCIEYKKIFLDAVGDRISIENGYSKTAVAGVNYLKKCIIYAK